MYVSNASVEGFVAVTTIVPEPSSPSTGVYVNVLVGISKGIVVAADVLLPVTDHIAGGADLVINPGTVKVHGVVKDSV